MQSPFGQSASSTHGSQLLPVPAQSPKRCEQVGTFFSVSVIAQLPALPQGQAFDTLGSHTTVQILVPPSSLAQIWFGTARQSSSVVHSEQNSRFTHRFRRSETGPQENSLPAPRSAAGTQLVAVLAGKPQVAAHGTRLV